MRLHIPNTGITTAGLQTIIAAIPRQLFLLNISTSISHLQVTTTWEMLGLIWQRPW
jgi:hypothetical protein